MKYLFSYTFFVLVTILKNKINELWMIQSSSKTKKIYICSMSALQVVMVERFTILERRYTTSVCPGHNTHNFSEYIISYTCSPKIYTLPELHDIFLKVAPYFESCMTYLTKFNDILKVA